MEISSLMNIGKSACEHALSSENQSICEYSVVQMTSFLGVATIATLAAGLTVSCCLKHRKVSTPEERLARDLLTLSPNKTGDHKKIMNKYASILQKDQSSYEMNLLRLYLKEAIPFLEKGGVLYSFTEPGEKLIDIDNSPTEAKHISERILKSFSGKITLKDVIAGIKKFSSLLEEGKLPNLSFDSFDALQNNVRGVESYGLLIAADFANRLGEITFIDVMKEYNSMFGKAPSK